MNYVSIFNELVGDDHLNYFTENLKRRRKKDFFRLWKSESKVPPTSECKVIAVRFWQFSSFNDLCLLSLFSIEQDRFFETNQFGIAAYRTATECTIDCIFQSNFLTALTHSMRERQLIALSITQKIASSKWPSFYRLHLCLYLLKQPQETNSMTGYFKPSHQLTDFCFSRTKERNKSKTQTKTAASVLRLKGSHAEFSLKSNNSWKAAWQVVPLFLYIEHVFRFSHHPIDLLIDPALKVLHVLYCVYSLCPCSIKMLYPHCLNISKIYSGFHITRNRPSIAPTRKLLRLFPDVSTKSLIYGYPIICKYDLIPIGFREELVQLRAGSARNSYSTD